MGLHELNVIAGFLSRATCPEDVFGNSLSDGELRHQHNALAKALHPDTHNGGHKETALAKELFQQLEAFHAEAKRRITAGTYGQRVPMPGREPVVIKGKYVIEAPLAAGDIADLHIASLESSVKHRNLVVKVARRADDNDLLRAEESALAKLREKLPTKTWAQAVPRISDAFQLPARRAGGGKLSSQRVNVMDYFAGFVAATEIHSRVDALDGRTIAWMWKRLIVLIEWTWKAGLVHGAILPPHVMFYPDNASPVGRDPRKHSIRLVDWSYSVEHKSRTRLSAWVPRWKTHYAPEILAKDKLGPWTDLYMGAMTMLFLAGAKIEEKGITFPKTMSLPESVKQALALCLNGDPAARPQSIGKYFESFVELLRKEFGVPRWHNFNLPGAA